MATMRLFDPVEILYLGLMHQWEVNAPRDGCEGLIDNNPTRNSQIARLVFILRKIAAGNEEHVYSKLAQHSRRNDGRSYISKDPSWMVQPYHLLRGWFVEGCMSLKQKQDITQQLTKIGLSSRFPACVDDFIAGRSVKAYFPTQAEQEEILARIRAREIAEEF